MTVTSITAADAVGCMAMPLPRAVHTSGTAIYTASATMTDKRWRCYACISKHLGHFTGEPEVFL